MEEETYVICEVKVGAVLLRAVAPVRLTDTFIDLCDRVVDLCDRGQYDKTALAEFISRREVEVEAGGYRLGVSAAAAAGSGSVLPALRVVRDVTKKEGVQIHFKVAIDNYVDDVVDQYGRDYMAEGRIGGEPEAAAAAVQAVHPAALAAPQPAAAVTKLKQGKGQAAKNEQPGSKIEKLLLREESQKVVTTLLHNHGGVVYGNPGAASEKQREDRMAHSLMDLMALLPGGLKDVAQKLKDEFIHHIPTITTDMCATVVRRAFDSLKKGFKHRLDKRNGVIRITPFAQRLKGYGLIVEDSGEAASTAAAVAAAQHSARAAAATAPLAAAAAAVAASGPAAQHSARAAAATAPLAAAAAAAVAASGPAAQHSARAAATTAPLAAAAAAAAASGPASQHSARAAAATAPLAAAAAVAALHDASGAVALARTRRTVRPSAKQQAAAEAGAEKLEKQQLSKRKRAAASTAPLAAAAAAEAGAEKLESKRKQAAASTAPLTAAAAAAVASGPAAQHSARAAATTAPLAAAAAAEAGAENLEKQLGKRKREEAVEVAPAPAKADEAAHLLLLAMLILQPV